MPYARKDTITWLPGNYYHLYNRGAQRVSLFREKDNYLYLLGKIKTYCRQFDLSMIAYCLMPNHYHFLVRQNSETRAGLLPQRAFNSYTKAYNVRYEHSGTLFERRYQAKAVQSYSHLLHLCRYIHANPVKDGLVTAPEDWPYSNYMEWIGKRESSLFEREFVLKHFPTSQTYIAFVEDYLQSRELPSSVKEHLTQMGIA